MCVCVCARVCVCVSVSGCWSVCVREDGNGCVAAGEKVTNAGGNACLGKLFFPLFVSGQRTERKFKPK